MIKYLGLLAIAFSLSSCKTPQPLPTVAQVEIKKYLGTWYEIARLPNKFEKDLSCVSANYSLKENGKIKVLNKGYNSAKSEFNESEGTAWQPNTAIEGVLKVTFFWPFAGDYYILDLAPDYSYVLVGAPSREYLWILSRTEHLDNHIIEQLTKKARTLGFNTDLLVMVEQNCP